MNPRIRHMEVPDDEWETAAVAQLRDDIRGLPGGALEFVEQHGDRLGITYGAFAKNLNGSVGIAYRTFMRAVAILGYSKEEYDQRIMTRIEAERRRAGRSAT